MAATYGTDDVGPQRVDSVAGHNTKGEMRLVLEYRVGCCQHGVTQQYVLGMDRNGSIDSRNHWHRNVDQVPEDLLTLLIHFLEAMRGAEVKPGSIDLVNEGFPGTSQDDNRGIVILPKDTKELDVFLVSVRVEYQ